MSRNPSSFDLSNIETLECQIDRLNNKIYDFVNNSIFSASESELPTPTRESLKKNFDDLDRYMTTEESEVNKQDSPPPPSNQLKMMLEDFRSHELREAEDLDLQSEIRSSFGLEYRKSELSLQEISINEIYLLYKQAKSLMQEAEEGDSQNKSIKFAGVNISFNVTGFLLPDKAKIANKCLRDAERIQELEGEVKRLKLKEKMRRIIPDSCLDSFVCGLEGKMKASFDEDFENIERKFVNKNLLSEKLSAVLVYRQFNRLQEQYKTCEFLSNDLKFQNLEAQITNNMLVQKYQKLLKKEGELNFRQQEINKMLAETQVVRVEVEEKAKGLKNEQSGLEREKRKLERMKNLLKTQMEEIVKPLASDTAPKRPISASRLTENSPTLRRIRSNSKSNTLDSEIEETQSEISKLEVSLNSSSSHDSVNLSKLRTKLSNLRSQKAIEKNSATSESINSVFHSTPVRTRGTREARDASPGLSMTEMAKPPIYKKVRQNIESACENKEELKGKDWELKTKYRKITNMNSGNKVERDLKDIERIHEEYERKIKELEEKIEGSEQSMSFSLEESNCLNMKIKKIKDLYGMIEEMIE